MMFEFYHVASIEATILAHDGHSYRCEGDLIWRCVEAHCTVEVVFVANYLMLNGMHIHPPNYYRIAASFLKDRIIEHGIIACRKLNTKDLKEIYEAFPDNVSSYLPTAKTKVINEIQKSRLPIRGIHCDGPKCFTFCACSIRDPYVREILEGGARKLAARKSQNFLATFLKCLDEQRQLTSFLPFQPQTWLQRSLTGEPLICSNFVVLNAMQSQPMIANESVLPPPSNALLLPIPYLGIQPEALGNQPENGQPQANNLIMNQLPQILPSYVAMVNPYLQNQLTPLQMNETGEAIVVSGYHPIPLLAIENVSFFNNNDVVNVVLTPNIIEATMNSEMVPNFGI